MQTLFFCTNSITSIRVEERQLELMDLVLGALALVRNLLPQASSRPVSTRDS